MWLIEKLKALYYRFLGFLTGYSRFELLLTNFSLTDYLFGSNRLLLDSPSFLRNASHLVALEQHLCNAITDTAKINAVYDDLQNVQSVVEIISATLNVRQEFFTLLEFVLAQMRQKQKALKLIEKKAAAQFPSDESDKQKLQVLWAAVWDRPLPASFQQIKSLPLFSDESSWADLGFQNPLSDFRGAGLLGYENLLYFADHYNSKVKETLLDSQRSDLMFPFAATGLNVTWWLLEFLRANKISVFFFCNTIDPIEIFHILYCFTFLKFTDFWKLSRPANIMQFGEVSKRFKKRIEMAFKELAMSIPYSEWSLGANSGEELIYEIQLWIGAGEKELVPRLTQVRKLILV